MSKATQTSLQLQGGGATYYQNLKLAGDADGDQRLDFLDVHRVSVDASSQRLARLKITVIGAGPAGLVFARNAALHGAIVTVFERAGDPRGVDAGYTNRSFNITLDNVGRQVLGDPRACRPTLSSVILNDRFV